MHMNTKDVIKIMAGNDDPLLQDLLRDVGIPIETACAGRGTCGKCEVQILSGKCTQPNETERYILGDAKVGKGKRLACQCHVCGPIELLVMQPRNMNVLIDTITRNLHLNPRVEKILLKDGKTRILIKDQFSFYEKGDTTREKYGLAFDLGTTTLVASLNDLGSGEELAAVGELNPQIKWGADVLSRIQFAAETEQGTKILQQILLDKLQKMVISLCSQTGINAIHIYDAVVVGNTAMQHLFIGLNPASLGKYPYQPETCTSQYIKASDLGFQLAPGTMVYTPPVVSGFLGGDIIAGLLIADMDHCQGNYILLDLGTNGEIILNYPGGLLACSCAMGPALEGMGISCGMRAIPGAIEHVDLIRGRLNYKVIGDQFPVGLCGSGLVELIALLLDQGIIASNGRLANPVDNRFDEYNLQEHLAEQQGHRCFQLLKTNVPLSNGLTDDPVLTQADIRALQMVKAAVATGLELLLKEASLGVNEVNRVYLGGAVGNHINSQAMAVLGFIHPEWVNRIAYLGNSALAGARVMLLDCDFRKRAEKLALNISYLETAHITEYERMLVKHMRFK